MLTAGGRAPPFGDLANCATAAENGFDINSKFGMTETCQSTIAAKEKNPKSLADYSDLNASPFCARASDSSTIRSTTRAASFHFITSLPGSIP